MEKITNARIKEEYLRIKHKSGATILLYPMKGYSTAYALFATKYGSVDTTFKTNEDPDFVTVPEGIAHYLEHKLFENDECDAFDLYAKTGANANAYTSFDKTAYLFSCSQKFEENLRILQTLPLLRSRESSGRKSECTRTIPVGEYFSTACRQCMKRTP